MRSRRGIRSTATVAVVAAGVVVFSASGGAATDPIVQLEKALLKRYPAVAGPLLTSGPYTHRGRRVLYTWGAVSVWFQTSADRGPACSAARVNSTPLRDAILGRIMPNPADVRLWASRGISPESGADAFRRGILRACRIRGG
jgi:hypothetical protein